MYWTVLSSFFITELNPGHFSWIHGLSPLTFLTLSLGTWAAIRGRIKLHRHSMRGSYLGLIGAFLGAAAVPQRDIPQLLVHRPLVLVATVAAGRHRHRHRRRGLRTPPEWPGDSAPAA